MNPHGIPYLRFILPFIAGLATGAWLDLPLPHLTWALIAAALLGALLAIQQIPYRFRWVFGAYMHVLLFAFGYFHIVQYNEIRQSGHFAAALPEAHYFIGTVYEAPSRGAKMKVPIRVEALGRSPDKLQPTVGNVMLFLESTAFADSIRYGDQLRFQGAIRPTEPAKNPYAFDYGRYLHFQNIHHQGFIKADSIQRLSSGHGWLLWRKAYESRDHLLSLLQQYFPSTDEYAVASALLVGYTDDLSDELRSAYAETGSMHALAVSGTHIGMLYVGLMF
jgi:competence protein ComEC